MVFTLRRLTVEVGRFGGSYVTPSCVFHLSRCVKTWMTLQLETASQTMEDSADMKLVGVLEETLIDNSKYVC